MTTLFSGIGGSGNPAYENLSNYFLGGATGARAAPSGVPSKRPRDPRDANKPGQQPSNGRTPIPTSSQKPGNREGNQRIPYSRMMFTSLDDKAAPREIKDGDAIFVHKTSMAMGGAPNRCNKCTSIPQLNAMLKRPIPGVTTLDLSDPTISARIKQNRVKWISGKIRELEDWQANEAVRKNSDVVDAIQTGIDMGKTRLAEIEAETDVLQFVPFVDWPAVKMLGDWTLDGVLISNDDDVEVDDTNQPQLSRDDGVLMNVCVAGPTHMRNTAPQISNSVESHMWNPQYIDQGMHVMDKVFVGLFYKSNTLSTSISFYYKLFSGRQALSMHPDPKVANAGGDSFLYGPSDSEFGRCCGAWRVGSVMDNKLTTTMDRHIQINVVVEWWDHLKLQDVYSEGIGAIEMLDIIAPSASAVAEADELVNAAREVEDEGDEAADALAALAAQARARQRGQTTFSAFSKQLLATVQGR